MRIHVRLFILSHIASIGVKFLRNNIHLGRFYFPFCPRVQILIEYILYVFITQWITSHNPIKGL